MPFLLFLLFYSFTNLTTHQSKETPKLGRAATLDSSLTACASEAAIRTFAGTEIYYGRVVEYKAYVMDKNKLIVRYTIGINEEILWITNSKEFEKPIIVNITDHFYLEMKKEMILLNLKNNLIQFGSQAITNNFCDDSFKVDELSSINENQESYFYTLNYIFLRFFYSLSKGGGLNEGYSFENEKPNYDYRQDYIPNDIKNKHVLIQYLKNESICKCDSVHFCHQPLKMLIYPKKSYFVPDTGIIYFPCPNRYFEELKDSFELKSVVIKLASVNNRYFIDTNQISHSLTKYIFMGFSNEIIK